MRTTISSDLLDMIAMLAEASPDFEICGIMLGDTDRIDQIAPCTNRAANPATHFELDPAALLAAARAERRGGPRVIGYYHSHPKGSPVPSLTDASGAASDGMLWLIASGDGLRCWVARAGGSVLGRFDPVDLAIEPPLARSRRVGQSDDR